MITKARPIPHTYQQKNTDPTLKVSIPVKGKVETELENRDIEGRLEGIGDGHARIFFDRPLTQGTQLSVTVEFKDRRNREIRFAYQGCVTSAIYRSWYETVLDFDEDVGISAKDAREILSDLFPEEV